MAATETLQTNASRTPHLPRGPYAISPEVVAADQRRRLLAAVPEAVSTQGVEGATVDKIVKLAAVKRNAFYEQFEDKLDCIAAAYEIAQERLLGAITFQCYSRATPAERIEGAIGAALELLAREPDLARLVVLEAPAVGADLSERHHRWIDRYGRLLRFATVGAPDVSMPSPSVEPAIVGGLLSRVRELMLGGRVRQLVDLRPELARFALSFYGLVEAPPARFVDVEPPQPQSSDEDEAALVPGAAA